jgi:hypothetical protein
MASSRTFVRPLVVSLALGLSALGVAQNAHAQPDTAAPGMRAGAPDSNPDPWHGHAASIEPRRLAQDRPMQVLYGSFVALQVLDLHSTMLALDAGGREANPVVRSMLGGVRLPLVKAAGAGGILYLTERLRRHNRPAAFVTMVALNSAYATIVAHNYAISRR